MCMSIRYIYVGGLYSQRIVCQRIVRWRNVDAGRIVSRRIFGILIYRQPLIKSTLFRIFIKITEKYLVGLVSQVTNLFDLNKSRLL